MKIDFNNVRRQAINAYVSLVKQLNSGIDNDRVVVFKSDIERPLQDLRQTLAGIACTYVENDDDFKCILEDDEHLIEFDQPSPTPGESV